MSINLVDTLIDEQPFINEESFTIDSKVFLSEINGSETKNDKCEYVSLPVYLDDKEKLRRMQQYGNSGRTYTDYYSDVDKCRTIWKRFELGDFIISKKLLEFFIDSSQNYFIGHFFSMSMDMRSKDTMIKIFNILISKYNHLREGEGGYLIYGEKGNQVRYGKFVNMILDMVYGGNPYKNERQQEVERTVDIYKSKFSTSQYRISILNGDDIKLGYDTRYQSQTTSTMLSQSCMNNKLDILKLYTINPDKIYLFVVTNGDGKIISRNLMWRLNKYNNFVFDRVYAIDNYIRKTVEDLARNENWVVYNEGQGIQEIIKLDSEGNSKIVDGRNLFIKLNFKGVQYYPYLDTFNHQRIWSNKMTNKRLNRLTYKYYHTNGGRDLIK